VGYFSADFHEHATMRLMAGLFEAHDKSRLETIGICLGHYGGRPDDAMRQRVKRAFDRFEAAGDLDDDQLLALARELDLHIAVDLTAHPVGTRMEIFARRIAPVQMHYIGYPGTLGMPGAIDYLVADRVLIPESARSFYTEKIIELPDSYQVNDRQRAIDPVIPSRRELGLPENSFVFCCFNNNYKITQEVFGLWMQLLRDKPDSVLRLLADNDTAARNLKQAARDAGVEPGRIIFAQRVGPQQHLARHVNADLFLDTWPCNAHTTASDALWAGLPVLTCMGETFASRVGASLLTACHLPELITRTPQEYLERARELAHDPRQLSAIRRKLQTTRLTVPLFDTERFTRHLETAYDLAWERFTQGLPPDDITVPPVA
jgi:predicted O-linked N-acetylglucosamine transferase (SPINDLY family)